MPTFTESGGRRRSIATGLIVGATGMLVLVASSAVRLDAHKAKTSPYSYNADIFPILRDKCGRCHVEGGPAPMSLMTYDEDGGAVAWAESIREMLLSGAMPPWYADPTGPAVRNHHALTPRELDKIITWATGGTPHGDLSMKLPPVKGPTGWVHGTPDVELPMPKPFTVDANVMQATHEVTLQTPFTQTTWVKAADLLPGVRSMVRRAYISVDDGPMLALWEPGADDVETPKGAAFKVPAHATLRLKIDYKKSWQDEQNALADTSIVGLYLAEPPTGGRGVESVSLAGPAGEGAGASPRSFTGTLKTAGSIVALRPMLDAPYASVDIVATRPDGTHVPLLKMRDARPEWPRRYWLVTPVSLPAGTTVEVAMTPGDPDIGPLGKPESFPLQLALDVVPN